MRSFLDRWMIMLGLCGMIAAVSITACGGGEEEAAEEQAAQPKDENFSIRQTRMREISQLCGGIQKALKNSSVENVANDARRLKEIMTEVSTIPPPHDTEKYKFYAQDFQSKSDALAVAAETGSVDEIKPAFVTLTETCGVCHFTCKYPLDL